MPDQTPRAGRTPLQRHLAGAGTSRPTAADAFRRARRAFLAGDRIDMQALARELAVDRATLYRWVGSRDQLLTEVLWSLMEPTIADLRQAHCHSGPPAVPGQSPAAAVMNGTVAAVVAHSGMQRFLDREGGLALRLLTTRASDFEARLIGLVGEVVREETTAGRLNPSVPLDDLPYVLVRIMESYTYLGLITGEHPDPDRSARVVNALLPPAGEGHDRFVRLDDGDLHVVEDGDPRAPALLLVHGSGASARSWDSLVPLLATSHRVIRIDLLGHGRSTKSPGDIYQTAEQGRRLGRVLDQLGVTRAIAVGHSSGGVVITALAEQRPDLVTALALINTGPSMDAFITQEASAIEPAQWPHLTDEQIRRSMSAAFSRAGYEIPQQLVDDVRAMTHHTFTSTMRGAIDYLNQRPIPDRLAAVGKPLLVLFGEDDRRWRSSSATDYLAVPGARVEMLPGLGHSPILEDPQRTAAPLLAFTGLHALPPD